LNSPQKDFKKRIQLSKFNLMENWLYIIAGIIIILWSVCCFGLDLKFGIHVLPIIAANLILLGNIKNQRIKKHFNK